MGPTCTFSVHIRSWFFQKRSRIRRKNISEFWATRLTEEWPKTSHPAVVFIVIVVWCCFGRSTKWCYKALSIAVCAWIGCHATHACHTGGVGTCRSIPHKRDVASWMSSVKLTLQHVKRLLVSVSFYQLLALLSIWSPGFDQHNLSLTSRNQF